MLRFFCLFFPLLLLNSLVAHLLWSWLVTPILGIGQLTIFHFITFFIFWNYLVYSIENKIQINVLRNIMCSGFAVGAGFIFHLLHRAVG